MHAWIPLTVPLLVLALAAPAVRAQDAYVPLQRRVDAADLARIGLTSAQLDALNRLLAQGEAWRCPAAAVPAAVDDGAPPPGPGPHPAPMHIGLDDGPVKAHASGTVTGWAPGTVFTLDNGQQWQVLKGRMTLRHPLQEPPVEVVPGIAGRWFLQVDPELPKARVFRVR